MSAVTPTPATRRVVVGTAGHIDHGKTSLVRALTGIDCDRWVEEKERGITIDLGFAHLPAELPSGEPVQIGFVDVPGHERFVHNALAGLGGIRLMMLVVAADEGIMPQTEEHLSICTLLGIAGGLVALTKADLVDEETLELAQLELEERLQGTAFEGVPIVPVSSKTGDGVEDLRRSLLEVVGALPEQERPVRRPARLPVDRAFHLKGLGVVTTGTLLSGQLSVGDTLRAFPGESTARIRSLQVHGGDRDRVLPGERVSAQLTGVDLAEVHRGTQLAPQDALPTSRILLVRLQHLEASPAPLEASAEVRLHLHTSTVLARIRPLAQRRLEPGESGLCVLYCRTPVACWRGDRFILRRPSPATTLAGGEVLDPVWRKPRRRNLAEHLEALGAGDDEAVREWVRVAGRVGADPRELGRRLGDSEAVEEIGVRLRSDDRLLEAGLGRAGESRWIAPGVVRDAAAAAKSLLEEHHRNERLSDGMPKAEFLAGILPRNGIALGEAYLQWFAAAGAAEVRGDRVSLPGRGGAMTDVESDLARRIVALYEREGLTPRSPAELQRELGAAPKVFEGLLRYLTRQGRIVRLPNGLFVSREALDGLRTRVLERSWSEISVPEFKDAFELSRKWAIPLLEYLDAQRVTRRRGDVREVLRPAR